MIRFLIFMSSLIVFIVFELVVLGYGVQSEKHRQKAGCVETHQ